MSLEWKKVLTCIPAVFLCLSLRTALWLHFSPRVPYGSVLSYVLCFSLPVSVVCKLWDRSVSKHDRAAECLTVLASKIPVIVRCITREPSRDEIDSILRNVPEYIRTNPSAERTLNSFFANALLAHEEYKKSRSAFASDSVKEKEEKYIRDAAGTLAPLFASERYKSGDETRFIECIYDSVKEQK